MPMNEKPGMPSMPIRCAIYARVSTDQQGDSIDNQVGQCREYISRLGDAYDHTGIVVYRDEAVSGYYTSVFDRAEMKRAIQDARQGKFKLLVFKEVSRVGRDKQENPAIIGMFEQYGVRVIAINDNYDSLNRDNITFDILSVLSEQESKKISARVSSARRQKARRGEWGGDPPIGYIVDKVTKKLAPDPETSHIPQLIFDLYVNKGLGTFKVAEYLNERGFRTRNGNLWSREAVGKVLRNPAYVGRVVHGARRNQLQREYDDTGKMSKKKVQIKLDRKEWQVVDLAHEPLIDQELFDDAAARLAAKRTMDSPRRALHLLTGILRCGRCGERMVCQKRSGGGKTYRYYICKTYHRYGRSHCPQANVNADELEHNVLRIIREKLEQLPTELFFIAEDLERDISRLEQEAKQQQAKMEKLQKKQIELFHERDMFAEEAYRRHMLDLKRQIEYLEHTAASVNRQISELREERTKSASFEQLVREFRRLEGYEPEQLRVLLHELVRGMTLTEGRLHIEYHYDFSK